MWTDGPEPVPKAPAAPVVLTAPTATPQQPAKPHNNKAGKRGKVGRPRKHPYVSEQEKLALTVKTEPITVKLEPNNPAPPPIKQEPVKAEPILGEIKMEVEESAPSPVVNNYQESKNTAPVPAEISAEKRGNMNLIGNIEQVFLMLHKDSDDDAENIDVNSFLANL